MKCVEVKFDDGVVFLCTKCFPRLEKLGHKVEKLNELRRFLKDRLKETGHWGKFRVAESSCLGHCPKDEYVCYAYKRSSPEKETCWTVPVSTDHDKLLNAIQEFMEWESRV